LIGTGSSDPWLERWLPLIGERVGAEIDENFYFVDGAPTRFFDRAAVDRLFSSGWRLLGAEERIIDRYERPKSAWEVVLEKAP
jgi:hypothetical protein